MVVLELDTNQLNLKAYGWGKAEYFSQKNGKIELAPGASAYQLNKGEKVIVFSPGFLFNWKEGKIKHELYSFIKNHHQLSQNDLMMELFLQLSVVKDNDFLTKDATVTMMEVNRHGIHQI